MKFLMFVLDRRTAATNFYIPQYRQRLAIIALDSIYNRHSLAYVMLIHDMLLRRIDSHKWSAPSSMVGTVRSYDLFSSTPATTSVSVVLLTAAPDLSGFTAGAAAIAGIVEGTVA